MKTIYLTFILFLSLTAYGQNNYEKSMAEAMKSWKSGDIKDAISKFENIGKMDKDNWLPKYYQALLTASSSFSIQNVDDKSAIIEQAKKLIPSDSTKLNAEWYVVNALIYTSELTLDPQNKAIYIIPIIMEQYQKALALEPENPRVWLSLSEFQINSKKYSGGDTKEECKQLEKALSLFEKEKHDTAFYPSWGKERTEQLISSCKN